MLWWFTHQVMDLGTSDGAWWRKRENPGFEEMAWDSTFGALYTFAKTSSPE
jgi:hypothetical protein